MTTTWVKELNLELYDFEQLQESVVSEASSYVERDEPPVFPMFEVRLEIVQEAGVVDEMGLAKSVVGCYYTHTSRRRQVPRKKQCGTVKGIGESVISSKKMCLVRKLQMYNSGHYDLIKERQLNQDHTMANLEGARGYNKMFETKMPIKV